MDIICPRCGEPWDFDTQHEEAEERYFERFGVTHAQDYREDRERALRRYDPIIRAVMSEFRSRGCGTFSGQPDCSPVESIRTVAAQAAYEVCGDDMDGAAAMMEDFGV